MSTLKGIVALYDSVEILIDEVAVNKLIYREDRIIERCIEEFGDEDPCIIHKTYGQNSLSSDLIKDIKNTCEKNKRYHIKDIEGILGEYLNLNIYKQKGIKFWSFR